MAHISIDPAKPGLIGLFDYRPETGRVLGELVETLLRGPSTLSRGERELIAAVVSRSNECTFCAEAHSAFAAAQIDGGRAVVDKAHSDPADAPVSAKLRALLQIALATRESGHEVTAEKIQAARAQGTTDLEIHDTVLIASMLSMFTRYVDGLDTVAPDSPAWYAGAAQQLVQVGYPALAPA
jgi:uncharacterized peroxidase-related enzyme